MDNPDLGPISRNAFLDGALTIAQPVNGYRAGVDPVLLAATVPAKPGQSVLDLGCGSGVAALCLGRRVGGLALYGLEKQPGYAALARENAAVNDLPMQVFDGTVETPPATLSALSFDHVIANPPYFSRGTGTAATDAGRETGRAGETQLGDWVALARRRLKPGGYASFIQDAAQLPELVAAFQNGFGALTILPISARIGRPARLIIVQARKGSASEARLLAPLILHHGPAHLSDGDDYSAETTDILRNAAEFPL